MHQSTQQLLGNRLTDTHAEPSLKLHVHLIAHVSAPLDIFTTERDMLQMIQFTGLLNSQSPYYIL